jgi:hypothetical protein
MSFGGMVNRYDYSTRGINKSRKRLIPTLQARSSILRPQNTSEAYFDVLSLKIWPMVLDKGRSFFGHDFFRIGFGYPTTDEIKAEMEAAWPLLREKVFQLARERSKGRRSIQLPAGWWLYEAPESRDILEREEDQLRRLGLDGAEILRTSGKYTKR